MKLEDRSKQGTSRLLKPVSCPRQPSCFARVTTLLVPRPVNRLVCGLELHVNGSIQAALLCLGLLYLKMTSVGCSHVVALL